MYSLSPRMLINIAIIISILLSNVTTATVIMAYNSEPALAQPALPPTNPASGLFRTRVQVDSPARWQRLESLGVVILQRDEHSALVLADDAQLADLARLRFQPRSSDELSALVVAQGESKAWLAAGLQPLLRQGAALQTRVQAAQAAGVDAARADLRAAMHALTAEQKAGIANTISPDDDGDGLTNTEESWWCTDPMNPDSDGDGANDGDEVWAAKAWLANEAAGPPATGKPFSQWPSQIPGCVDDDQDSVPDMAERWDLGLNMNRESTDRDKFDDGQELFGNTYCPGSGGFCGYGALPRNEDWGVIFAEMPAWVKSPGNHPLVAAFPVPEVDVVESSFHVQTVTTVTTDRTITEGTERSYSTAKTEGTSTSVADTETWNSWQETTVTQYQYSGASLKSSSSQRPLGLFDNFLKGEAEFDATMQNCGAAAGAVGLISGSASGCANIKIGDVSAFKDLNLFKDFEINVPEIKLPDFDISDWFQNISILDNLNFSPKICLGMCGENASLVGPRHEPTQLVESAEPQDRLSFANQSRYIFYESPSGNSGNRFIYREYYPLTISMPTLQVSESTTKGTSVGGARTTTNTEYEEHTITNGEAFSSSESWGTATAVDSAHAADLWFTYKVRNTGTEYAREIANLAFNIYIGDDPNPATTYFVADDVGGDGKFHNFMPDEEHTYTSARIPLTLEQMKAIDLGGPLRIVVEDFTYGIDELFYQDAVNAGVLIAIEDGTDDGDEAIDTYLIPTWGDETVLDVLARYFPHEVDENGMMVAIWTPEQRADTPGWCVEPRVVGTGADRTLWCKHALSTADWWNIYTDGMGDGSEGFQDTPASGGAVALFRFNKDSDLDGYSDRSETRLGTDPNDASNFPRPELIAGVHSLRVGDHVTATLSLLNTGLYDAYGVEAVMIAPDDSVRITNNTVGGSGRVRAQKQVIVGSRILLQSPMPAAWTQTGHASPAVGGYYIGLQDRTYTFTVQCSDAGGCQVGDGNWTLAWDDGAGNSGALNFGAGYASPTLQDVGGLGVRLGLLSGHVENGEQFTLEARTPRDTFQYDILREPYTEPIVIVSYNDPQGNHRLLLPSDAMSLAHPNDDLVPLSGEMLPDVGVEIVTSESAQAGANSTDLLLSNPSDVTLTDAHLFLEFINITGTVVSEIPVTATVEPGPNVITVDWDTADFDPAYQPDEDYIVMAFWTDYQGNILDTAARPLSSFQDDPRPAFAMAAVDETWDFGTAQQGTLMQRQFTLASVGYMDLLTHIGSATGISVQGPIQTAISPGDMGVYTVTINTQDLPIGPYTQTIPIRTSDPATPTKTITIQGEITAAAPDTPAGDTQRPLDWDAYIEGSHNQGEWVNFTHTLGPDPQTLHPVKVYSADYSTFWGVGKYATDFRQKASQRNVLSYERKLLNVTSVDDDSNMIIAAGATKFFNPPSSIVLDVYSGNNKSIRVVNGEAFSPGDEVLIIQMQGRNVGVHEFAVIEKIIDKTELIFSKELSSRFFGVMSNDQSQPNSTNTYPLNVAQIIQVPHYNDVIILGTLKAQPWNGKTGGVIVFKAKGTTYIGENGSIDVTGQGYLGGPGGNESNGRYPDTGSTGGSYTNPSPLNGSIGDDCGGCISPEGPWNGGGGRGGRGSRGTDGASGGGGGSYGSKGQPGQTEPVSPYAPGGIAGSIYGSADLSTLYMGSGGGGGGKGKDGFGAAGGNGGGIINIQTDTLVVDGILRSNGANGGTNKSGNAGGGGGGSGGSIYIYAYDVILGANNVTALGGNGSVGNTVGNGSAGGNGGVGRIRIEYCNPPIGNTNPPASMAERTDCYITEQIESSPYDSARLNLPESFSNGRNYQVQYGRRFVFSGGGEQSNTLRLPASMLDSATLDALISDAGSGTLTFKLDIGDDGSWDWQVSQSVSDHASWTSPDLSAAFNQYWSANGAALSGDMDVPVRVSVSKGAQVLLTNLRITPAGDKTRFVRLDARTYDAVQLTFIVSDGSGPLSVAVDVGDDGVVDWTWNGDPAYPVQLTTDDLASAFNAYLSGQSGEVDVPVRFYLAPMNPLGLTGFTATPAGQVDVQPASPQVSASSPTEGDEIALSATLQNNGDRDSGPLTVSFFATPPGGSEWYIGSAFVPNVPAGGAAQASIPWNTLGFTGDVPVRVVVDPFNRLAEANEDDNEATATLTILTRPDLAIPRIQLSDDEPLAGESITITLPISNTGQTNAASAATALTAQTPDGSVVTLCEPSVAVGARSQASATCAWTPMAPGRYRLLAHADKNNAVDESDEGNNDLWRDVYVGLASPVLLDSGGANDPAYDASTGYGYLNGQANAFCGSEPDQSQRSDPGGEVAYRFTHLQPGHFYHLDISLYECDGLGRREQILVDGNPLGEVVDLSDGEVHRLSIRLDPAFYADRTIDVGIKELLGNDAVVASVHLYDIDYRYADAGGTTDAAYTSQTRYGWLDGVAQTSWGTLPYQSRRIDLGDSDPYDDPDNELRYRFDELDASKAYRLHLVFYQNSGGTIQQTISIDGVDTGTTILLNGEQRLNTTVDVPIESYQSDGSIVLQITRIDALAGAFVNEVALEEDTQNQTSQCSVQRTPNFTEVYGNVTIGGASAPPGTLIEALNPRGDVVGCFVTNSLGEYGLMRVFGENNTVTPTIPGMRVGEIVIFRVNGEMASVTSNLVWENDQQSHAIDLASGSELQAISLRQGWTLFSFRLQPPNPALSEVTRSINGNFDLILGEDGTYNTEIPPQFNQLHELLPGQAYWIHTRTATTLNISGTVLSANTPLNLHNGWNWIGFLPSAPISVVDALRSIDGKYIRVVGDNGTYDVGIPPQFNQLKQLHSGEGYLIYMAEAGTLIYPAVGLLSQPFVQLAPTDTELCPNLIRTPYFSEYYGYLGTQAAGRILQAYDPRKNLVGCTQIQEDGSFGLMRVYGSKNPAKFPLQGLQPGDSVKFDIVGYDLSPHQPIIWQPDYFAHRLDLRAKKDFMLWLPTLRK